jgi:hypothetical protein
MTLLVIKSRSYFVIDSSTAVSSSRHMHLGLIISGSQLTQILYYNKQQEGNDHCIQFTWSTGSNSWLEKVFSVHGAMG